MTKSPFDFINPVVYGKGRLPEEVDHNYNQYLMNIALSMYPEDCWMATVMTVAHAVMDDQTHYDIMKKFARKKRPFVWPKAVRSDSEEK